MKIRFKKFLKNNLYLSYIVLKMLYFMLRFHEIQSPSSIGDKTDILFSTDLLEWRKINASDSSSHWDDIRLGAVMKSASQSFKIIALDEDKVHRLRTYEKSRNKFGSCEFCIPIEKFFDIHLILKAYHLSLQNLKGTHFEEYDEFINITGHPRRVDTFFRLLLAEKILSIVRPRLVFLNCEFGGFRRALSYIAKKKRIPVMTLQHGVIASTGRGYIFKEPRATIFLPDLTCVYGREYKNILVKHSVYTEEMVVVTGSPRYDFLHSANRIYSREKVLKKLGISSTQKKLILWTTQTHGLPSDENIANLSCILHTISGMGGVTLIVKQHPGEKKKDTLLLEDYIKKYSANNVIIVPKDSDTYELIYACDLMITRHSTTALEAVILDKPVIALNLSGKPDPVDYVAAGVALGVRSRESLESAIKKLLEDDSDLRKNRAEYIDRYLYKVDGKSTERVLTLIQEMIEKGANDS